MRRVLSPKIHLPMYRAPTTNPALPSSSGLFIVLIHTPPFVHRRASASITIYPRRESVRGFAADEQ